MNSTRRLLLDTSFRIIDDDEGCGFNYICDPCGVCSREDVMRLMDACKSHLEHLSKETIDWNNQQHREEQTRQCKANDEPSKKEIRKGFVYLMRNQRNGMTKIGFSINPKFREKTLQSEEPEIVLLESWEGTMENEDELHEQFAGMRVRGEWFNLNQKDIDWIAVYRTLTDKHSDHEKH